MNTMTLDQFRTAFQAGGLASVGVTADGGRFFVTADPHGGGRVVLATTRGRTARGFGDAGKAIALLHSLGACRFEMDVSAWSPGQQATEQGPQRWGETAAYDAWFRSEIEDAIREADDPDAEWIINEAVKQESAELRAKWLTLAAGSE